MIELQGTEKQIRWAEDIRTKKIVQAKDTAEKAIAYIRRTRIDEWQQRLESVEAQVDSDDENLAKARKRVDEIISKAEQHIEFIGWALDWLENKQDDAAWWIENRHKSAGDLIDDQIKLYAESLDALESYGKEQA